VYYSGVCTSVQRTLSSCAQYRLAGRLLSDIDVGSFQGGGAQGAEGKLVERLFRRVGKDGPSGLARFRWEPPVHAPPDWLGRICSVVAEAGVTRCRH
jgi:hypothetical protein